MKHFKKRTLALVLASVVTVVGSFASTNYKNSLLGISFDLLQNGVNMNVETRDSYSGNITPIRKDINTYVLTLPEVNSLAEKPDLTEYSQTIQSVEIRTMPYSANSNGYTRITIKTKAPVSKFTTRNKIFVPVVKDTIQIEEKKIPNSSSENNYEKELNRYKAELAQKTKELEYEKQKRKRNFATSNYSSNSDNKIIYVNTKQKPQNKITPEAKVEAVTPKPTQKTEVSNSSQKTEVNSSSIDNHFYFLLLAFLILIGSVYFVKKAFKNMDSLTGERIQIDVDDTSDTQQKKNKNSKKQIKTAIKDLDNKYPKTAVYTTNTEYKPFISQTVPAEDLEIEEVNVVDLDQVYNEHISQNSTEEEENQALEDFLSGFSFDEEFNQINGIIDENKEQEEESFDEEFYSSVLENKDLNFSKTDIDCINKLLSIEINDATLRNIEKYAVSNPIKKVPTKQEILEDLVTSYAISQDVKFDSEDIKIIKKIMNVELEQDFITDLRVNPQRTDEMEKEIQFMGDKLKKPSDIVMMSVKDLLPDLSEALKKQGKKRIESNYKPETVYFSKGYDVNILNLNTKLPDLTKELDNENAYEFKPTAEIEYVDKNFDLATMQVDFDLPDLNKAINSPKKYIKPKEENRAEVNEDEMLKSIMNVEFKPFYDGSTEIEVLNEIPTVSDINKEFENLGSLTISDEEEISPEVIEKENTEDTTNIFNEEYIDLDAELNNKKEADEKTLSTAKKEVKLKTEEKDTIIKQRIESNDRLERTKLERAARREKILREKEILLNKNSTVTQKPEQSAISNCILEGESYMIVSTTLLTDNIGCHLAKNENGYVVLGFIGDKLFKIKNYSVLNSEQIQSRHTEKTSDNKLRYIVRIGINKFILDVENEDIKFVMDLC